MGDGGHGHGGHGHGGGGGYGLFYNYGVYPGYRTFELEENREKKLTIEDDIITGFFLGSLTVLSLFLLYRLFERMPSKMED